MKTYAHVSSDSLLLYLYIEGIPSVFMEENVILLYVISTNLAGRRHYDESCKFQLTPVTLGKDKQGTYQLTTLAGNSIGNSSICFPDHKWDSRDGMLVTRSR